MANLHVSGWWVPGSYLEVLAVMSKADVRTACRKRWGKDWYKVHPVIKKARMSWAAGGDPEGRLVIVHEGQEMFRRPA